VADDLTLEQRAVVGREIAKWSRQWVQRTGRTPDQRERSWIIEAARARARRGVQMVRTNAKISAGGATEMARWKKEGTSYLLRSDGKILVSYGGGAWKLFRKFKATVSKDLWVACVDGWMGRQGFTRSNAARKNPLLMTVCGLNPRKRHRKARAAATLFGKGALGGVGSAAGMILAAPLLKKLVGANPGHAVRFESRGGKYWVEFYRDEHGVSYRSEGGGGFFGKAAQSVNEGIGRVLQAYASDGINLRRVPGGVSMLNPKARARRNTPLPGDLESAVAKVIEWASPRAAGNAKANAALSYAKAIFHDPRATESSEAIYAQLLYLKGNLSGWRGADANIARACIDKYTQEYKAKRGFMVRTNPTEYEIFFRCGRDGWNTGPFRSKASAEEYALRSVAGWRATTPLQYKVLPHGSKYPYANPLTRREAVGISTYAQSLAANDRMSPGRRVAGLRGVKAAVSMLDRSSETQRVIDGANALEAGLWGSPNPRGRKSSVVAMPRKAASVAFTLADGFSGTGYVTRESGGIVRVFSPSMRRYYDVPRSKIRPFGGEKFMVTNPCGKARANPPRSRTITLQQYWNESVKAGDKNVLAQIRKKFGGYEKWTHGTKATKVKLEWVPNATLRGTLVTYDGGRQPEALYAMPPGTKRTGLWRHPWTTQPTLHHDPESGMILTKLRGKSRISNFYHH
jgi:hypothetical protein